MLVSLTGLTCFGQYQKNASIEKSRNLIIFGKINDAIVSYALPAKNSNDPLPVAEYAYALALGGIYDAALIQLDRLWFTEQKPVEVNFFASQVLALMGYNDLAAEFWKEPVKNKTPLWIASKSSMLLQKYKRRYPVVVQFNTEELKAEFRRANELASQNLYFQSVVLFQEIVNQYPDEYLPYIGFSITLEKIGLPELSMQVLEKGISLVSDDAEHHEMRQILEQQLISIRQKISSLPGTTSFDLKPSNVSEDKGPQMMAYAGGMATSSYSTFNCRYGYFVSGKSNASFDIGMNKTSGGSSTNLGFSIYSREKIFVSGAGLQSTIQNGAVTFYTKISVGLSFMNAKRTASYDVFLDGNMGLTKGATRTIYMSIGRSLYFGKRK